MSSPCFPDGDIESRTRLYQIIRFSDIGFSDFNHVGRDTMRAATKWIQTGHYQVVGAALAAARQRANLTQVQLAKRLRKPQSAISAIEAGMRRVDLVEFLAIVRVLEGDPVEIFAEIVRSLPKLPRARR